MIGTGGRSRAQTAVAVASILVALVATLSGCDLVVYNAGAVSSARAADDLSEINSFDVEGWFYDRWDDSSGNVPTAFYPFTAGADGGYLITPYESELNVRVVFDGVDTAGFIVTLPGDATWDMWVVPRDAEKPWTPPEEAFAGYEGFRPIFVAVTSYDGVDLLFFDIDPEDRTSGSLRSFDLPTLVDETVGALFDATPGLFSVPAHFLAVNAVYLQGPPVGDFPFFPWDSLMIEFLTLSEETGQIEEYLMLLDDDHARDVVNGTFLRGSTLAARGDARFPLPDEAALLPPSALSYAFDPETSMAFLSYRTDSPVTLTWNTFSSTAVPEELASPFTAGPVTQAGRVQSGRTGRITARDANGVTSTRNLGNLWYAGQYERGDDLRDIYTYVGATAQGNSADLVVTTFTD